MIFIKSCMNDIIVTKKSNTDLLLANPMRRTFLKFAALGSAALILSTVVKKVKDIPNLSQLDTVDQSTKNKNLKMKGQYKDMRFSEDEKEFTVHDKDGASVLIFEKEV